MLASTLRGYNGLVSTAQGAVNVGLPLTQDGFLNLSLEYRQLDPTIRSGTRADAATLSARGYPLKDPAQIWGSPDIDGVWNTFFNAGVDPSTVDVPSLDASFDEIEAFIDRYRGDLFLFNERFPGGFTPRFGADIQDMSLVGRAARRARQRPQVGCQRQRGPQQHRILHLQHHQRLTGASDADLFPAARLHPDRGTSVRADRPPRI